jgi:hypothetical protein
MIHQNYATVDSCQTALSEARRMPVATPIPQTRHAANPARGIHHRVSHSLSAESIRHLRFLALTIQPSLITHRTRLCVSQSHCMFHGLRAFPASQRLLINMSFLSESTALRTRPSPLHLLRGLFYATKSSRCHLLVRPRRSNAADITRTRRQSPKFIDITRRDTSMLRILIVDEW